jgi:hypothetical protein
MCSYSCGLHCIAVPCRSLSRHSFAALDVRALLPAVVMMMVMAAARLPE